MMAKTIQNSKMPPRTRRMIVDGVIFPVASGLEKGLSVGAEIGRAFEECVFTGPGAGDAIVKVAMSCESVSRRAEYERGCVNTATANAIRWRRYSNIMVGRSLILSRNEVLTNESVEMHALHRLAKKNSFTD
jgi:hypothetical protein